MGYVLNSNSRTVHDADSRDGRCRLSLIREENRFEFETLEEAMEYLPNAVRCPYCIHKEE
ncbi:MAG: hypothetical protein IJE26_03375 [Oscillospiraceae bacterium]|nr:hypothetical protein [Oscillospiraceae bacterium]